MATINVSAGGDLQAAIDSAVAGDEIVLEANATFTGNFVLPVHTGTSYITIKSAGTLPADGVRVTPETATDFAIIKAPSGGSPAISFEAGASYWKLIGLEFLFNPGGFNEVISIGSGDPTIQTTTSQCPQYITIDRCYIHNSVGLDTQKRAIGVNGRDTEIKNCYIKGVKYSGQDSQAICGWNGPGPLLIDNNYLEAASENILFGGAEAASQDMMVSDVTITNNYVTKDPTWRGVAWQVKNCFEIKCARRVTVDSNTFEYAWADAQSGWAIQFTVRANSASDSWATVEDVVFSRNIIRHAGSALNILGHEDTVGFDSGTLNSLTIRDNVFYDISTDWGGAGRVCNINHGGNNITIDHNTFRVTQHYDDAVAIYLVDKNGIPCNNLVITNNIFDSYSHAVLGTNGQQEGSNTLNDYAPGYTFTKNVMIGQWTTSIYPSGNFNPATSADVGFTDEAANDYSLLVSSTYHNAATDGTDIGARGISAPAPADDPPPVLPGSASVPSPANGATGVAINATLSWAASSNTDDYNVAFGTTSTPSVVSSGQAGTTYNPGALSYATTYYWQVTSNNADGSTDSPVWSFTTVAAPVPPGTPTSPTPANGSTSVAVTSNLFWSVSGATSYDVAFGTSATPPTVSSGQASASYNPTGNLEYSTTYYWQITAHNADGSTVGPVWSFTTSSAPTTPSEPEAPHSPSPANGELGIVITILPSWASSTGAVSYDVAFDTTDPPAAAAAGLTSPIFSPSDDLAYNTTYYWKVTARNNDGVTEGPVWSFTTQEAPAEPPDLPDAATNPTPANGAIGIACDCFLRWDAAARAVDYDVYLGIIPPEPPPITSAATDLTYPLPEPLDPATTYYWQVVSNNEAGSTSGDVWSFTTAADTPALPEAAHWELHRFDMTARIEEEA